MRTWKENFEESKQNYLKWWNGEGLVISMWEHFEKAGAPHEPVPEPPAAASIEQYWFDPEWRAAHIHYQLSRSSLKADILPVANTHLGPGSLAAAMGAQLQGRKDTIWITHGDDPGDDIVFDQDSRWWRLHLDLLHACKALSQDRYLVGCPDLVEGLDTLASLRGAEAVLMDLAMRPEVVEKQLQAVNDAYFMAFDQVRDIISVDGEMAFCYFSIWGPGSVTKLQSDISLMISEADFRRFCLPFLREQCRKIDYTLYHLDGVGAMRHVDALLEIDELNAIQWTPGVGQPQGGDPRWYPLYRKILAAGKGVMPSAVKPSELKPLLDNVGGKGLNCLMHFASEADIDPVLKVADPYR
jgi:hypothetical protein